MAQYVAVRAISRSANIRVKNSAGDQVKLTPTTDVIIDLDDASNRRQLARHTAIGQYVVSAVNAKVGANVALPADT
jgi:hypothetical protein